jgi:LytS/YehU family sensor histidine kinase
LEIQAKSELDDWDRLTNIILLPIECNAPFWSTAWFWIGMFALIIFFVIQVFRRRIKIIRQRQREEKEVQQRINESEQLALKSQMNPHFIFNSLNSIQQYVIDRDVKGANSFISGFSKLMRQTLDFSSKEKVALTEEIGYLQNYLELERVRMESKFDFTIIIETISPVTELRIPPLLLQPYVENALRHGVRYLKDESGHIALSFIEKDGVLDCIIEDNGIGREKAGKLKAVNPIEYQSKGMSLTAERVELLNRNADRKIVISITDLTDANGAACGTRVSVKFPV